MTNAPRLHLLSSPGYLTALAVLLLNDRIWKAAAPSVWTGKLSDFAGLVVLPVLVCAVWGVATRRRAWAVHLGVGGVFAALQFVDLGAPLAALRSVTGVALAHTPDPTDLVALAVLPLGVALALGTPRPAVRVWTAPMRLGALALSLVAVAGTSAPLKPQLFENEAALLEHGRDPDEVFAAVEDALKDAGVYVRTDSAERVQRIRHEDDVVEQAFEVTFEHAFPAGAFDPPTADTLRTVSGWLLLSFNLDRGTTRIVDDWDFDATGAGGLDREALERVVRERVLRPIEARDAALSRV